MKRDADVTVGANLQTCRKARGMSVQELADKIGISRSHLGGIETGYKPLSAERALAIAEFLGVPVSDILSTTPTTPKAVLLQEIDKAIHVAGALGSAPDGQWELLQHLQRIKDTAKTL